MKHIVYDVAGVEGMMEGMRQALLDKSRAQIGFSLEEVVSELGDVHCLVAAVNAHDSSLGKAIGDKDGLVPFYGVVRGEGAKEKFRQKLLENGYRSADIKEISVSEIPMELMGIGGVTKNLKKWQSGAMKDYAWLITWPAEDDKIYQILSAQNALHKPKYGKDGVEWESPEERLHPITAYYRVRKLIEKNSSLQAAVAYIDMRGTDQEYKYGDRAECVRAYGIIRMPTEEEIDRLDIPAESRHLVKEAMVENFAKQAEKQYGGRVRHIGFLPPGGLLSADKLPYECGYEGILKQLEAQIERNDVRGVHIGINL